jgi:hypothetical protein
MGTKYLLDSNVMIIAATALVHKLTLLTRNVSDFKNIPKLVYVASTLLCVWYVHHYRRLRATATKVRVGDVLANSHKSFCGHTPPLS